MGLCEIISNIETNKEVVNSLFSIVSILLGFVVGVATYLASSPVPALRLETLGERIKGDDIYTDISDVITMKKDMKRVLFWVYMGIVIILLGIGIMYRFVFSTIVLSSILVALILLFGGLFIYFACKILKIIDINLSIDEQILSLRKSQNN